MSDERIILVVGPDGQCRAETSQITGEKCLDVIPLLEDLLEGQAVSSSYTAEFQQVFVESSLAEESRNELGH